MMLVLAVAPKPFTIDDFLSIKKPADAVISPDGSAIAFVIVSAEGNRWKHAIHVASTSSSAHSRVIGEGDNPVWSPDGRMIAFLTRLNPRSSHSIFFSGR